MSAAPIEIVVPVVKLPPYPTKAEIVDALNAAFPDRRDKFTERMVRGWQERKYIRPHKAFRNPTRFDSKQIAAFLEAKMIIHSVGIHHEGTKTTKARRKQADTKG